MKYLAFFSLLTMAAFAVSRADRLAKVDAEGVMRWTDDGSEVALFGVNYYPPFTVDYRGRGALPPPRPHLHPHPLLRPPVLHARGRIRG